MQYDAELAEIMNKYKPGSAVPNATIEEEEEGEEQKSEEQKQLVEPETLDASTSPVSPPVPSVAQTLSNGDLGGVPATMPPQVAPTEVKRPSDKEVLEVLRTRFEDLWRLEVEHETLKRDYSSLDQAKSEVDKQKAELQKKTEEQDHQIEQLKKALEEEKSKNVSLDKRLKEAEHKLEGEKERYVLLSGQFEELNNKLVEIVTNVTHMKTDELSKLQNKSPRRQSSETPTKPNQAIPPATAGTGFSAYFSTTPTKPGAGRK